MDAESFQRRVGVVCVICWSGLRCETGVLWTAMATSVLEAKITPLWVTSSRNGREDVAKPKEEILGQFLGDDQFPVTWDSEAEKSLFWVFDDLHCPHPLSPMFADIGGWWLSCDHMFRRFGTSFAADWLAKSVNGYLYTAIIPADPDLMIESSRYGGRYTAHVPRDRKYSK